MKKSVILAGVAAIALSGYAMADEQKAPTTPGSAPTTTAAPTTTGPTAKTTTGTGTTPTGTTAATTPTTGTTREVRLNVKGLDIKESADWLKTALSEADGVRQVHVDESTGNVTAQIDPAKTSADKLCNWVKTKKTTWDCTLAK